MEMGWKPNVEVSPPCPRCGSSNTKFCYYNNYSLTQPRYFCKACRRYWTKGGSLRNVPVGGGCRKTRRHKSTRPASTNHRVESSSISAPHEPSTTGNIDIAAVYANFLNHAPPRTNQAETASHLHEGTTNVPSIEFSDIHLSSNIMHPEINGFFQCEQFPPLYGHGGGNSMFPVGFEASGNSLMSMNIPMENDLLPPLPGEEGLPPWPNSVLQNQLIMNSDQEIQPSDQGNSNGNMGMFNGLNLEAIFRT